MAEIRVTVVDGKISVYKNRQPMGTQKDQKIKWKLETSGWKFPQNGIVFENGGDEFFGLTPTHGGTGYECMDRNSDATHYKYTITLDSTSVPPLPPLVDDPYIENGGIGGDGDDE